MLEGFAADPEAAFLFAFEGRRVRGGTGDRPLERLCRVSGVCCGWSSSRGHRDGTFAAGYSEEALAIALMGAVEALLRERLIARRANRPDPFTDDELKAVFAGLVSGLHEVGGRLVRRATEPSASRAPAVPAPSPGPSDS